MTTTIFAAIGDQLGLFKSLALGPATSTQLANSAHMNERYAREWLGAMASAGYLEYDPLSHSFTLPPEYVPMLAQESGPIFLGGLHQMLLGMAGPIDTLVRAFQRGGGVAQANYDENVWDGMERFTNGWYENLLVQQWLPTMPDVQEKLVRGVSVADIGCGRGRGHSSWHRHSPVLAMSAMMCSHPQSTAKTPMRRQPGSPTAFASNTWTRRMAFMSSTM